MYARMGLLEGIRVERSGDPEFRKRAASVDDYFVDVTWEGEIVRARYRDGKLLLHKGADRFIEASLRKNSTRHRSAPPAIRGCAGCSPSSAAPITSPEPVSGNI